ncbi:hypothetical protein OKA04_01310 [Luteolibacter flavescens]|uniref:Uncharacterized protein n=1 Tax=Luteolibacter flavescens TaxID=1859460 RepID=A0ABT3FIF5_9BACT|nr:hypothetical protein [Luteolibacter flavescens]MCW1883347.1 hypothetical protein [Luteolibacter flavescens]
MRPGAERWLVGLLGCFLASGLALGQEPSPLKLPGAKQRGVGCAFYANVPALTRVSGIHIVDHDPVSNAMVASIYGLRKGDFAFRSAFDKEVFFELFGMSYEGVRHDYADLPRKDLLVEAERLIARVFDPALESGHFISLRSIGPFGGPHNVLLLARAHGKYHVHDPTTGAIVATSRTGLAGRILSEIKNGSKLKKRYFSAYHIVNVGSSAGPSGTPLRIKQLPESMDVREGEAGMKVLETKLTPAKNGVPSDFEQVAATWPAIDFAMIRRKGKDGERLISAIDPTLAADQLHGAASLAKLAINSYQIGARDLLPVWWIDGQPLVVAGYKKSGAPGGAPTITWLGKGGGETVRLSSALAKLKSSGSLIGYVQVPRKEKTSSISIDEDR